MHIKYHALHITNIIPCCLEIDLSIKSFHKQFSLTKIDNDGYHSYL